MAEKYKIEGEQKSKLLKELRQILTRGDEREFMRILRKYGIKDENPLFSEIVKLFRDLKGGKK
jgi:hypothetical protein